MIRVRDIAYGTRSQIGAGGDAVALLVDLCLATLRYLEVHLYARTDRQELEQ